MIKKSGLLGLGLLLLVASMVVLPTYTQAQGENEANFVLVNYIGQEINLDLDDVTYTVPGTDTAPEGGRFTMQLAPGEHKYAVTVPGQGGAAGEFMIEPGQQVGKSVVIEKTGPVVDRNGIILEGPQDEVRIYDFDPAAPIVEEMPVVDTWQPSVATPGQGSLVWINQGGIDELTVDLEGQLYKVPPQSNGIPGRLQIDISPGQYNYTVSVPNGSLSGKITVEPGQVTALDITPVREEPEYEVGEKFKALPPAELKLNQTDLTAEATSPGPTDQEEAPAALPPTGGITPSTPVDVTDPEGLTIKNFTGDTLIFTIDNQAYTIANQAEQTLPLPPGQYNYTASLPFVATTGTVNLETGQNVELSVAINVAHDFLSVYQN